ncbi:uncharacterized protein LACBIDRAFT_336207 [Laccaria bicolor S238N-H82]|uniref:Predicted protein n=1 Tax=Laccaria bicolor (strain S238N-H82 / ATCC MYA-4686) TaxID=486041 RepID=B0E4Q6_LACBS|nr:uncharacterized protein LACBIDRAFT_336207 [Laccaria bicolor S238N-H82]EDQ98175.1 predicted protein [Laccaria bicolor S238N-H82]|eukprot:XP_001891174.1 predicted protein [Laccaria bicolor S238N-H82]
MYTLPGGHGSCGERMNTPQKGCILHDEAGRGRELWKCDERLWNDEVYTCPMYVYNNKGKPRRASNNYRYIPPEQKQLIVTMHIRGTSTTNIEQSTGISTRTIRRILKLWNDTGRVMRQPLEPGRPRVLNSLEVEYLESLIEQRPDIYVTELQNALFVTYGAEVDASTITQTLYRRGFTRKKVQDIPIQ